MLAFTFKNTTFLILLAVTAIAGNYYTTPLFFGLDFFFGGVAVLLSLYLFGLGWGLAIAFLASAAAAFHTLCFPLFFLEALFIGLNWRRPRDNLLLLVGIFWLCLGVPLIWLMATYFTDLTSNQILLLLLKSFINGIVNAILANLLILLLLSLGFHPHRRKQLGFQALLLNIIMIFAVFPELANMSMTSWELINRTETQVTQNLKTFLHHFTYQLQKQQQHYQSILQQLTENIAKNPVTYNLAKETTFLQEIDANFVQLTLLNAQGDVLLAIPQSIKAIQFLALSQLKSDARASLTFYQHSPTANNRTRPLITQIQPLNHNTHYLAISYHLNLEGLQQLHPTPLKLSLIDKNQQLLGTTRQPMSEKFLYINSLTAGTITNYRDFSLLDSYHLEKWQKAFYLQNFSLTPDFPLILVLELPLKPYITSLQQSYILELMTIVGIIFIIVILAMIVSRKIVEPLRKLALLTTDLPDRLEQDHLFEWPKTPIQEMTELTDHFRVMAKSLKARFEDIRLANLLLEERVKIRNQELANERHLLRNLIDSIPDLIFYKNCEGYYLGCNQAFEVFIGYSESFIIGKNDFDLYPNDKAHHFQSQDQKILAQEITLTYQENLLNHRGLSLTLETLKTPFYSSKGQILGLIGISRDIALRQQVEENLHHSQDMLRIVIDNVPQSIFWKDWAGVYLGCNTRFAQMIGVSSSDFIIGKTNKQLQEIDNIDKELLVLLDRCLHQIKTASYHCIESLQRQTNTQWFDMSKVPLHDINGNVIGILSSFEDVTEKKRTDEKLKQAAQVLENSTEAICITDAHTHILSVNKAFAKITGYTETEVIGKKTKILSSGKHDKEFYKEMWYAIENSSYWEGEIWNRRKTGEIYPEWLHISVIKDESSGEVSNYLAIFSDISRHKQNEQRLAYLAHYDQLTSLPNRTLFYERLNRALTTAHQNNTQVAILFLDLDRFKYINDTWGHAVGDLLLKDVASRLLDCVHKYDTVARLGGDEFTAILENISNGEEIGVVAQNILEAMKPAFNLNGYETFMTTSIGISIYPSDGKDAGTLLKHADTAMYRAKESGKNNYQFFTSQMNIQAHRRVFMEVKLRHALERDEFILYYQPQIHLASGYMIGAEALLRWQHPEMGLVSPKEFISLAEETGLVVNIGEWVLREVCLQHQRWRDSGLPILRLAVNLSSRQFHQADLVEMVSKVVKETRMDVALLELEITESVLMEDFQEAAKILNELKRMGISIAIDDFGTGYSSLSYLKLFPVDKLKIDRSFIQDIPANQDDMRITKAIVALARSLHLQVIAEGVENKSQMAFLKSLRCDEIQGFLMGRPMPAEEFIAFVQNHSQEGTTRKQRSESKAMFNF